MESSANTFVISHNFRIEGFTFGEEPSRRAFPRRPRYIFALPRFNVVRKKQNSRFTRVSLNTERDTVAIIRVSFAAPSFFRRRSFVFAVLPILHDYSRCNRTPERRESAASAKNLNCLSGYRLKLPPPVSFRLSSILMSSRNLFPPPNRLDIREPRGRDGRRDHHINVGRDLTCYARVCAAWNHRRGGEKMDPWNHHFFESHSRHLKFNALVIGSD